LTGRELREPNQNERCAKRFSYETSCGPNGLVSILLLAIVSRRQGAVAEDLQAAADHAEILLGVKIRKHQHDALQAVHDYLAHGNMVW
jgi:hypothetical protein